MKAAVMARKVSVLSLMTFLFSGEADAQGLLLPGGGAMHMSMAGTSTAVGADAIGALYWNPAVISGLPQSEVVLGTELIIPHTGVTSTIPAGALGGLLPAQTMSGRTNSDSGLIPTTAIGLVYRQPDSCVTYGLGLSTTAAGGVNFPGDAANPILAPTGPLNRFILGPQAASLTVLSITPTMSYQVTDCLAIGGGPMVDVSAVSFDPAFFGPTSQANPLAPNQFPTGSHSRPFWGGGFRGGLTYKFAEHITAGLSYTSPQWFETWVFNARDANGNAEQFRTQFSLPQIFSAGLAYDGIDRLLLATDVRWFDYSTTKLLGQSVAEGGAGWSSIWAVSFGAKYQVNDKFSVQAGYLFNENPISSNLALFNTLLPAITEHTLTCGSYYQVNDSIGMSLAYAHGFENKLAGTLSPLAGTAVTIDSKYDSIIFGIHVKFGACCCRQPRVCEATCSEQSPTGMPVAAGPLNLERTN
jgi:long-chain fatty acid transport protein